MKLKEFMKEHKDSIENIEVDNSMWETIEKTIHNQRDLSFVKRLSIGLISFSLITVVLFTYVKNKQIEPMSPQVAELKMNLKNGKTSTRLKAVRNVSTNNQSDNGMIDVLLQTFKLDESVHVRLAVLNTLKPYAKKEEVKVTLIKALNNTENPRVILEIISILDKLNESDAKGALKSLSEKHGQPIIRKEASDAYNKLVEI